MGIEGVFNLYNQRIRAVSEATDLLCEVFDDWIGGGGSSRKNFSIFQGGSFRVKKEALDSDLFVSLNIDGKAYMSITIEGEIEEDCFCFDIDQSAESIAVSLLIRSLNFLPEDAASEFSDYLLSRMTIPPEMPKPPIN